MRARNVELVEVDVGKVRTAPVQVHARHAQAQRIQLRANAKLVEHGQARLVDGNAARQGRQLQPLVDDLHRLALLGEQPGQRHPHGAAPDDQ